MKLPVAVLLLVCLLLAGTVSAVSMNPGSVGAAKTIVPTTTIAVTKNPAVMVPVSIATTPGRGTLEVYSVPSGATVTVSGTGSVSGTTPAKFSLFAGTYTVKVSLAGYKDYTETFTLTSGAIKDINADLQKSLSGVSASNIAHAAVSATMRPVDTRTVATTPPVNPVPSGVTPVPSVVTPVPGTIPVYIETDPNGADVIVMNQPDQGLHTPVTVYLNPGFNIVDLYKPFYHPYELVLNLTPGMTTQHYSIPLTLWNETDASLSPMSCPNADWTCLTPAGAAQQFGYPNAQYGNSPCGYAQENGQTVFEYCFMDVDSGGSLSSSALAANSIRNGDTIYIANQTWVEHAVVNKSMVLQETGPSTPFQSIFSFFNNMFGGGKITPETRLQRVGLNPQPEPPAQDPLVRNAK